MTRRWLSTLVFGVVAIEGGRAMAERLPPAYEMSRDVAAVPHGLAQTTPGFSNVVYLNNCRPNGCRVLPGDENATANPPTSIIPTQSSLLQPFKHSDAVWKQIVACVRDAYAPFDVEVTDVRPASGNFHMAIIAGTAAEVQRSGVGGVAPFNCGYIANAISYTFANSYAPDVERICWTAAQETAHAWGLDHKLDNRDPMTYLSGGPARKYFQNEPGPCGEYEARDCMCGGSTVNSFSAIMATFGNGPLTPPTVRITTPRNGEQIAAGFSVAADISDDMGVNRAELYIDDFLVGAAPMAPYAWSAPRLRQGLHRVKVIAYDFADTPAAAEIEVTLGTPCKQAADCEIAGDFCIDGRCIVGAGVAGGLGAACLGDGDCASGECGLDSDGNRHCVESCDPDADRCPSGFSCLPSGQSGVCWPGGNGSGCTSGGPSTGWLLLVLGALAIAIRSVLPRDRE